MTLLARTRRRGYNCADFAAEALGCPVEAVSGALATRGGWRRLSTPSDGCLTLMRRNNGPPHVGIYKRGGVMHLGDRSALFQPMHIIKRDYNRISFYVRSDRNH